MSLEINELTGILNEVRNELANQISLANSKNEKMDIKKLSQKAHELDRIIAVSRISDKDKLMLQKFSATLVQDNTTVKSLRYEKQDLERIFSNLEDLIQ
ncbi:MAG: hypothetical protein ACE5RC_02880 [Nitrosopumilus sp.]